MAFILAGLALRRGVNKLGRIGRFSWKKTRRRKRQATPRRFRASTVLLPIFSALFVFQGVMICGMAVGGLSNEIRRIRSLDDGRISLENRHYTIVAECTAEIELLQQQASETEGAAARKSLLARIDETRSNIHSHFYGIALQEVYKQSGNDGKHAGHNDYEPSDEEIAAAKPIFERLKAAYDERALDAFKPLARRRVSPFAGADIWRHNVDADLLRRAISLMLLLGFLSAVAGSMSMSARHMGKVEWDMEWLYTFPVSTGSLFAAKLLEYALTNVFGWLIHGCLLFVLLLSSGLGAWSVPLAVGGACFLNLTAGAVRLLAETAMRVSMSAARVKNVQAILVLVSVGLLYSVMGVGLSPKLAKPLVAVAASLPSAVLWVLPSAPAMAAGRGAGGLFAMSFAVTGVWAVLAAIVSARAAAWLVRDGLVVSSAALGGTARRARGRSKGGGFFRGIVAKDLALLLRDRSFFARTIIMPALMVGFQLVINDRMLSGVLSNFRHASMFAFATGAMVLLMGATQSLIHEHKAIWLLYTVPQRLSDIMRKRAVFWWCIASVYATIVLVIGGVRSGGTVGEIVFMTLLVWAGTLALSFMAVGLGVVGTDLNAPTIQERMSVGIMYLYMLLAGAYAAAIYTPWMPVQIVIVGIYALVAWGVWSWAKSKFPLLLDPA